VSVEVTPVEAVPVVRLRVLDEATTDVVYDRQPVRPHPDAIKLPAGSYRVEASVEGATKFTAAGCRVRPPRRFPLKAQVKL
jgi:hypothetical protein